MSSFFQKGNRYARTPATIVLYGFSNAFTSLRFAFTAINPVVQYPTVIPITIYTVTGATPPFVKTYYQNVERAIIVLSSASDRTNPGIPNYSNSAVSSTSVTLSFSLGASGNLASTDYYVLKTPPMGSTMTVSSGQINVGGTLINVQVLPKNRFAFFQPTNAGISVGGGSSFSIVGLTNPDQGVVGSAGLELKGYLAHFGSMTAERITFSMKLSDFMGKPFPSGISPWLSSFNTQQNHLLGFSISCFYVGLRSLIIQFPSGMIVPRDDCYEAYQNDIPLKQCIADVTNAMVYVTFEDQTYSSSALNLKIIVPVKNYITTIGPNPMFSYRAYTTVEKDPTNALGL